MGVPASPLIDTRIEPVAAVGSVVSGKVMVSVLLPAIGGRVHRIEPVVAVQLAGAPAANALTDRRSPRARSGCPRVNPSGTVTTTDWPAGDAVPPELATLTVSDASPPGGMPPVAAGAGPSPSAGGVGGVVVGPVVGGGVVGAVVEGAAVVFVVGGAVVGSVGGCVAGRPVVVSG